MKKALGAEWRKSAVGAGARIRAARQRQKLSLEDLAERADVDIATLSRVERGLKPEVSAATLVAICRELRLDPCAIWAPP